MLVWKTTRTSDKGVVLVRPQQGGLISRELESCQGEIIKKPGPLIKVSTLVLLSDFAQMVYEVRHLSSLQRASVITLNAARCLYKGPQEFPVGGVCGLATLCAAQMYWEDD